MKIKFLGASGQVTGSCFLLTASSGVQILIDCGMFQGSHDVHILNREPLECDTKNLAGVILTHAHLDHCGRLPVLTKSGLNSNIWMTPATADITNISLFDTAHINEEDERGDPLYNSTDVENTLPLFKNVDYGIEFEIGPFKAVFRDAGHIIGSAFVEIIDSSSKQNKRIVFSGDLGNSPEDLIRPTEFANPSDSVVMETTYGDRTHPAEDVSEILTFEINEVEKNDGALLIPTFSIERSQELVHRLSHLKAKGVINPETMVFFDSPMGERVTEVFEQYSNYYNKELLKDIKTYDPFHFPGITYTKNSKDSRAIAEIEGAKIIVAGSGMMTGGRIVNHAKNYLPLESTRLLFVGYQAEGTLGRELINGAKDVLIEHEHVDVNATVTQLNSLSSHADQPKLLNWLKHIKGVQNLFLVHGEEEPRKTFASLVATETAIPNVYLPNLNEEIDIR